VDPVLKTKRKPTGAAALGAGPGRPKGSKNKTTLQLKEMILAALDGAGGVEYLQRQANESPGPFLSLIGKVLPTTVTGPDGGAIKHSIKVVFGRDRS
jgi:hypothetical protein